MDDDVEARFGPIVVRRLDKDSSSSNSSISNIGEYIISGGAGVYVVWARSIVRSLAPCLGPTILVLAT